MKIVHTVEQALLEPLFVSLSEALHALDTEQYRQNCPGTFWFDYRTCEPTNLVELAICRLRQLADPHKNYSGAEWWLGLREVNESMSLHFDRDSGLYLDTRETVHPDLASIMYFSDVGRPTIVLNHTLAKDGEKAIAVTRGPGELVSPRKNLFVMFPGDRLHGVLPMGSSVGIGPQLNTRDRRITLLVNWWAVRPRPNMCVNFTPQNPLTQALAVPPNITERT